MFEQSILERRRSALGDWIVRGAIAAVYILFGLEKFPADRGSEWVKIFQQIGFGQWFRYFTGVAEVLGGVLVLIPWTAAVGLALLACVMSGAVVILAFVMRSPLDCIFPGAFLIGLVAVWLNRRD